MAEAVFIVIRFEARLTPPSIAQGNSGLKASGTGLTYIFQCRGPHDSPMPTPRNRAINTPGVRLMLNSLFFLIRYPSNEEVRSYYSSLHKGQNTDILGLLGQVRRCRGGDWR